VEDGKLAEGIRRRYKKKQKRTDWERPLLSHK
jgi:hypothetical protein